MPKITIEIVFLYKIAGVVVTGFGFIIGCCGWLVIYIFNQFRKENNDEHDEIKENLSKTETKTNSNSERIGYLEGRMKK